MIRNHLKSKIFIKIWLWSLLWGIVFGIGLSVLIGLLTGLFKPQTGGDDMAQGFVFAFMLLGIGNLTNYVVVLVLGSRYIKQNGQNQKVFFAKAIPLSVLCFILSCIIVPLLLFGSVLSALVAVTSINRVIPQPSYSPVR